MAVAVENNGEWLEQPASRQFLYGGRPNAQGRRDEPYVVDVKASYTPAGSFWCDGFWYGAWACPHAPGTWTVSPSGAGSIGDIIYPTGCLIKEQVAKVHISAFGPVSVTCQVGAAEDSLLCKMWGFDLKANNGQPFVRASTIDFMGVLTHAVPITPFDNGGILVKPWFWKSFIGEFGGFEHVYIETSMPGNPWSGQIVIHTAVECKARVQNPFAPDPNRNYDVGRETVVATPLPRSGWNTIPDPIVADGDQEWQKMKGSVLDVLAFHGFYETGGPLGQNTNVDGRWRNGPHLPTDQPPNLSTVIYTPVYSDPRYTNLPAAFYRDIAAKVWSAPIPGPNQGLWYNGSKPYRIQRMWRDNWWIDSGSKPSRTGINQALALYQGGFILPMTQADYDNFATADGRLPGGWTDWNDLQTKLDVAINGAGMANKCPCGNTFHTASRKDSNIWHENSGYGGPFTRHLGHQGLFHLELWTNAASADANLRVESSVAVTEGLLLHQTEGERIGANQAMVAATSRLDTPGYLTVDPEQNLDPELNKHNHWLKGSRTFQLLLKSWREVDKLW